MKTKRSRTIILLLALAIVSLLAYGVWFSRQVTQQHLDQALIEAIKRRDTLVAITLLSQGADVNAIDRPHEPVTLKSLFTEFWIKLTGNDPPKKARNYPQAPMLGTGRTALMWAAEQSDFNTVQVLLLHKANVNAQDEDRHTALWMATERGDLAVSTGAEVDIVRELLRHGAKVDLMAVDGETIFGLIAEMERPDPEIVRLLRKALSH